MSSPGAQASAVGGRARAIVGEALSSERFVLYLIVVYVAALAPFLPGLATPANVANVLSNAWPLFAVAMGQTLVLIIAGVDLSQGAVVGLTSVVAAALVTTTGSAAVLGDAPIWGVLLSESGGALSGSAAGLALAIATAIAVGAAIGALNGLVIARFDLPPFIVTLATFIIAGALAVFLTQSENIANLPASFVALGKAEFFSVQLGPGRRNELPLLTAPMAIVAAMAVALSLVLNRTLLGRQIYAIGHNRKAAEISGVPTRWVIFLVFTLSGVCAAIGSVLYTARLESGRPTLGEGAFLLDVIGAVVIGGASLAGGRGRILWTFLGVLFFVILSNSLSLMNLTTHHILVIKGLVILAVALMDAMRVRAAQGSS